MFPLLGGFLSLLSILSFPFYFIKLVIEGISVLLPHQVPPERGPVAVSSVHTYSEYIRLLRCLSSSSLPLGCVKPGRVISGLPPLLVRLCVTYSSGQTNLVNGTISIPT